MAPEHGTCAGCDGCRHIGPIAARVLLNAARTNYVRALREAVRAGVPLDELARDGEAFSRAVAQVLAERGGA